jgi:hypothetical protein
MAIAFMLVGGLAALAITKAALELRQAQKDDD